MRRLRVCHLITELGPAGAERCVYELARRVDRSRFDVQVAALRGGAVADWLAAAGVPVTVLGVRGRWDVSKLALLVELLRGRVDLLHTHLFHADLVGRVAASLAAVPHLVHTVHTAEGRFRPWQFAMARLLAGACDRIICVSPSVQRLHARRAGLPAWRYAVIPNGIDADAFAHDAEARRRLRQQWGLPQGDDQVLLAYVGRLDHEKGIDVLLSAVSHLAARGTPVDLVIAGDGPQRRVVENFVAHGEGGSRCRYLGHVDEVCAVLSAADLLVVPSRWEGFALAAAEAMACGLAVIGSDVPGLRDLVLDGRTGLLVERADGVALAETIVRLSADAAARRAMGQAGRERIVREYPLSAMVAAHERLYLDVAGDLVGR
ncbi:MAG: glycosyltransferase [Phycisphaerae bacterium]|nr:glycosyltransferase [Phycisphaerae bacterium]